MSRMSVRERADDAAGRGATGIKSRILRRINKNDRFNLHFVVIAVVSSVGGSAIEKNAIKIDRSVTIGVGRTSDAR